MVRPGAVVRPVGTVLQSVPSLAEVCPYPAEIEGAVGAQCTLDGPATLGELKAPRCWMDPCTAPRQAGTDVDDDTAWTGHVVLVHRAVQHQTQECRPLVAPPATDARAYRTLFRQC